MARTLRDRASIVRHAAPAALRSWLGVHARRWPASPELVPVLMYHRVLRAATPVDDIEPGMYVREATFERHLAALSRRTRLVTLSEAFARRTRGIDAPLAVLTFDDGWRDNVDVAWPALARHGARATIFLVRDWVRDAAGGDREFMNPGEVRDLARERMEFGAHSLTHPRLTQLGDDEIVRELTISREAVADWTGRACTTFAYPFGDHDERVARIAARLFTGCVIVGGGWWGRDADPARIPRVALHEDMTLTSAMFHDRLLEPLSAGA